jgi:hypothetical protein
MEEGPEPLDQESLGWVVFFTRLWSESLDSLARLLAAPGDDQ